MKSRLIFSLENTYLTFELFGFETAKNPVKKIPF
jgi:hypothetical protein